jgi:hypothetical protein
MGKNYSNRGADNGIATFTIPGAENSIRTLMALSWSYSAAPTGGKLTVESPANTAIREWDITAGGPGFFPGNIDGVVGEAIVVKLAAGGSGVVGVVNGEDQ